MKSNAITFCNHIKSVYKCVNKFPVTGGISVIMSNYIGLYSGHCVHICFHFHRGMEVTLWSRYGNYIDKTSEILRVCLLFWLLVRRIWSRPH